MRSLDEDLLLYRRQGPRAYLCRIYHFPFIPTFISNDFDECMRFAVTALFLLVGKIVPGAGSVGVN